MLRLLEDNIYGVLAIIGAVWIVFHMLLIEGSKSIPAPPEEEQDLL